MLAQTARCLQALFQPSSYALCICREKYPSLISGRSSVPRHEQGHGRLQVISGAGAPALLSETFPDMSVPLFAVKGAVTPPLHADIRAASNIGAWFTALMQGACTREILSGRFNKISPQRCSFSSGLRVRAISERRNMEKVLLSEGGDFIT